jgi:hypothetical protein
VYDRISTPLPPKKSLKNFDFHSKRNLAMIRVKKKFLALAASGGKC